MCYCLSKEDTIFEFNEPNVHFGFSSFFEVLNTAIFYTR